LTVGGISLFVAMHSSNIVRIKAHPDHGFCFLMVTLDECKGSTFKQATISFPTFCLIAIRDRVSLSLDATCPIHVQF
jgi:hypothetical protein